MKRLIFAFAVIVAWHCNQAYAAPAECFSNSSAVFDAHPNASHASYIVRGKRSGGSGRCWFADAFRTEAKTSARPASHSVAAAAQTSAPRAASATLASQLRSTEVAFVPEPRTTAIAPASPPAIMHFPREIPPAIQIAVNVQELSRLLPADEAPADFESRFSVSGYRVQK